MKSVSLTMFSRCRTVEMRVLCGTAMVLFSMSGILNAQAGQMQTVQTYEQLTAAHPGWVQVPGQLMRADCVHEIPNGARVEIGEDGQATGDVTLNGEVIAHYDACPEAPISTRHMASSVEKPGHAPGPPFNGWVEDSQEDLSLSSSDNIDWESNEFYVPNDPSVNGGLIYLFNGIVTATQSWILQPVLQYGLSPAGGGNFWAVACWLVSSTGTAYHSPLANVNPGDTLWGYTEQTGASSGTLYYTSEAKDLKSGAYSWISIWSSGLQWTWAYEGVLEVYGVNSCSELPSSGAAYFFNNGLAHGYPQYSYVTSAFIPEVFQSGCNDWVYVYNPSNLADLFY